MVFYYLVATPTRNVVYVKVVKAKRFDYSINITCICACKCLDYLLQRIRKTYIQSAVMISMNMLLFLQLCLLIVLESANCDLITGEFAVVYCTCSCYVYCCTRMTDTVVHVAAMFTAVHV